MTINHFFLRQSAKLKLNPVKIHRGTPLGAVVVRKHSDTQAAIAVSLLDLDRRDERNKKDSWNNYEAKAVAEKKFAGTEGKDYFVININDYNFIDDILNSAGFSSGLLRRRGIDLNLAQKNLMSKIDQVMKRAK